MVFCIRRKRLISDEGTSNEDCGCQPVLQSSEKLRSETRDSKLASETQDDLMELEGLEGSTLDNVL